MALVLEQKLDEHALSALHALQLAHFLLVVLDGCVRGPGVEPPADL